MHSLRLKISTKRMKRMSYLTSWVLLVISILFTVGCVGRGSSVNKVTETVVDVNIEDSSMYVSPRYAKGYRVSYPTKGIRLLDIEDPQNTSRHKYRVALLSSQADVSAVPKGYVPVRVPIKKTICMTTLQLSNFIALEECERVVGITSTRHLFSDIMRKQLNDGYTHHIGIEGNFDAEVIMNINPDVIFISPFKRGGYDVMRETGIPLVPHLGYKEMTPLGQAEWVKFVAMFIGKEKEANELFANLEKSYLSLKALASKEKHHPKVLSGTIRGGNWYAVGGKSFLSQLFNDAGGEYFLSDDKHSGGLNFDFENIYSRAADVPYWRIVNSYKGKFTYDALSREDARYADFKAFRERGVIYCNFNDTPYYETMPMRPDLVLSDLIHIFHPNLLDASYVPHYYKLLKDE